MTQETEEMAEIGDNTSEQRRALTYHHKRHFETTLALKKAADAKFKNACKTAKADGVLVDDIKLLIRLDSPEGEAEVRSELKRRIEVAGWASKEIGTQFSFDDIPNRDPLTDRAYDEGRTAGYEAKDRKSPYEGDAEQEWLRGYADGQKFLMETLDLTREGMKDIAKAEKKAAKSAPAETKKPRGRPKKAKANGAEPAEETSEHEAESQADAAPAFEG